MSELDPAPPLLRVQIEVPRWSFLKRQAGQGIEYISPLPSPYNYGFVLASKAADGEAADALVLGPRLPLGAEVQLPAHLRVRFMDAGLCDDKFVCGTKPPSRSERLGLCLFFWIYAGARRLLNLWQGRSGRTAYLGLSALDDGASQPCARCGP